MPDLRLVPKPIPVSSPIPDAAARAQALEITQSFLVEAPAGSGKTTLLIQRFLKLLAIVDDPARVLAITFTRKATAELVERVLKQLARPDTELAQDVLARDRQLGWNLLDHPHRLNIRTIDGICRDIANSLPILSGSGGAHSPTEDAAPLYAEAARRTLMSLGSLDHNFDNALELILLHRDGNLANCEDLIASMLQTRDQWGELVPLSLTELDDRYLDKTVLPSLDRALDQAICRALTRLTYLLPEDILARLSELAADMASLDGYKGSPSPIAVCAGNRQSPAAASAHLDRWQALIHLLVKASKPRGFRRSVSRSSVGFEILKHHRVELKDVIARLADIPGLLEALCHIDNLPPAQYPREQWVITKALFRVLARALTELQLVFAERGQCDFAEIGLLARAALRNDSALDDLSTASGIRLQHLLVDEMQDISTAQYEFIQLLTRRWDAHSQTVFLVGDPRQSIYLFRQARVERFIQTLQTGRLGDLPLTVLRLTANFRSQPALVQAFNDDFSLVFQGDPSSELNLPYHPVQAIRAGNGTRLWQVNALPYPTSSAQRRLATSGQRITSAAKLRATIEELRARPTPVTIAVLVRTRSHLNEVIAALRQTPAVPFRAVEIDSLAERREILDLLALTRALLHPADRTAWLAFLRSPACGLSLADLHRLASPENASTGGESTIFELLSLRGQELSPDGIARLRPVWTALAHALTQRGTLPLAAWVARTWRALGFPASLQPDALTNADSFFKLLDHLEEPGKHLSLTRLHEKVAALYAAPSTASDAVDLMTMHKAKGLEWDVVLVPELHRTPPSNSSKLLSWLEMEPGEGAAAGILAPIAARGEATARLNLWMRFIENAREAAERKRLFYVACTRAKEELHLFAAPTRKANGAVTAPSGSLLQAAWPAAEPHFTQAQVIEIPLPAPTFAIAATSTPTRLISRIPHPPGIATSRPFRRPAVPPPPHVHFPRAEGSFAARALGNTLHAFLDQLATRVADGADTTSLAAEVPTWRPRILAVLRSAGLAPAQASSLSAEILRGLAQTLADPQGQWILSPHPAAASESALQSASDTIRLDRTFLAGPTPLAPGATHRWIVDYKTATHGPSGLADFLKRERLHHARQLDTYVQTLADPLPIRLALYYPLIPHLVWWPPA